MSEIEAVYRHGVFEPLGPVNLPDEEHVRLSIERLQTETWMQWLDRVKIRRELIFNRQGTLPDSTIDITEDRAR